VRGILAAYLMCRKNRRFQYTKKAIEKRFGPDLKKESCETNIQILEREGSGGCLTLNSRGGGNKLVYSNL